jgi:hypothetical protein
MNDKWLICLPQSGLGNRLRFMSICYYLAQKTNRNLALWWNDVIISNNDSEEMKVEKNSQNVGTSFESIFKNDIPLFKYDGIENKERMNYDNDVSYITNCIINNPSFIYKKYTKSYTNNYNALHFYKVPSFNNRNIGKFDIILIEGNNNFSLEDYDEQPNNSLLINKSNFYKSLEPVDDVKSIIDINIPMIKDCICIHARSYDKNYDPLINVNKSWYDENNYKMIENMINYHIEFNQKLNIDKPKFLLLSNNNKIKEYFSNKYGDMIISYNHNYYLRNEMGIKHALIEWYLMANCKMIYGGENSSFSTEASYLNNIKFKQLIDGPI